MNEVDLEREVRRLFVEHGLSLTSFHVPDSRGMRRGLPDWIIIGQRGVLWRELKSDYGSLSAEQWDIGHRLCRAGQNWGTWRPADLTSGRIERELAGLAEL